MSDEDNGVEIVIDDDKKQDNDAPEIEIVDSEPEKQARLEAERRAQEAHNRAHQATADKTESDYQLVVNAIETVNTRNEQLKNAYADAMATQDYSRAAEIQLSISSNAQQLSELKRVKKP